MWTPALDLRHATRRLTRDWRASIIVVFVLVAGLAPNILLFSLLHTLYVRPLPVPDADNVAVIKILTPKGSSASIGAGQVREWAGHGDLFEGLAAFRVDPGNILTAVSEPEVLQVVAVTPGFFDVLKQRPFAGRTWSSATDGGSGDSEVVISYGLWRRQFGADGTAIGRPITLGGRQRLVVGVMPERFDFPKLLYPQWAAVDAWVPLRLGETNAAGAGVQSVLARLQAGAARDVARQRLTSLLLPKQRETGHTVSVRGLREEVVGDTARPMTLLSTSAALLMLLACINIGHILLARSEGRRRQASIRLAIGATSGQLAREQYAECLLLSACGGALALLFVQWMFTILPAILPASLQYLGTSRFSVATFATAMMAMTIVTMACGLLPALTIRSVALTSVLVDASAGAGTSPRRRAAQRGLVVSEIGFAMLLILGAAGAFATFWRLVAVPAGFDPANTLTVRLSLSRATYKEPERIVGFYDTLLRAVAAQPGVVGAAASSGVPGVAADGATVTLAQGLEIQTRLQSVTGGYFGVLGIPVQAGRLFDERDGYGALPVAIIDGRLASRLSGDAIGQTILLSTETVPRQIVGVVRGIHLYGSPGDPQPHVYLPLAQVALPSVTLLIKHAAGDSAARATAREAIHRVDPAQPPGRMLLMSDAIGLQSATERFSLIVLAGFGFVGLVIAASGLYGLVSYMTSLRAREIAVRMSLGAPRAAIRNQIVLDGITLVASGVVCGVVSALVINGVIEIAPGGSIVQQPFVVTTALVFVLVCAAIATIVPAFKASRIDPALVLRE